MICLHRWELSTHGLRNGNGLKAYFADGGLLVNQLAAFEFNECFRKQQVSLDDTEGNRLPRRLLLDGNG